MTRPLLVLLLALPALAWASFVLDELATGDQWTVYFANDFEKSEFSLFVDLDFTSCFYRPVVLRVELSKARGLLSQGQQRIVCQEAQVARNVGHQIFD
jgi:hypothetical protein